MTLIAICREVDRETGRVTVYPVPAKITGDVLTDLQCRARFTPELRYFTLVSSRWERYAVPITAILQRESVTRADLENIGGIIEL